VARALPLPPANLTDATLQKQRSDGSIYYTIRHGGTLVMPGYAYAITPERAWDVVNYVRTLKTP
jgi:mono/diheme cytochrome c family protein